MKFFKLLVVINVNIIGKIPCVRGSRKIPENRYRRLKDAVRQRSTALILLYCKRVRPPLLYRCLAVTPTDGALWQQGGKRRPLCGKKSRTPKCFFTIATERREHIFSCRQDLHRLLSIIFFLFRSYGCAFRAHTLLHPKKVALRKGSLQKFNSARESDPCSLDLQRPRVYDTYNVCTLVKENKLIKLLVNSLQEIL